MEDQIQRQKYVHSSVMNANNGFIIILWKKIGCACIAYVAKQYQLTRIHHKHISNGRIFFSYQPNFPISRNCFALHKGNKKSKIISLLGNDTFFFL